MVKLFEEYNKDKYYTEMDPNEIYSQSYIKFTKIEFEKIKKLVNYKNKYTLKMDRSTGFDIININLDAADAGNFHRNISIYKAVDEWYIVWHYIDFKYYKCDQIDGLLQCLEDTL